MIGPSAGQRPALEHLVREVLAVPARDHRPTIVERAHRRNVNETHAESGAEWQVEPRMRIRLRDGDDRVLDTTQQFMPTPAGWRITRRHTTPFHPPTLSPVA